MRMNREVSIGKKVSAMVLAVMIALIPVVYADAEGATSTATVNNAKPLFLHYWVDGQGPVEYESDGTFDGDRQNGAFYCMWVDPSNHGLDAQPFDWAHGNDGEWYLIRVEPPVDTSREVLIRVEIQDDNGYDDLAETEVHTLINIDNWEAVAPPKINLAFKEFTAVNKAIFEGSFTLYKETACGHWTILFQFRDQTKKNENGWYSTNAGHFYDDPYMAISIHATATTPVPTDTLDFGSINPGQSTEKPLFVQNNGNMNLRIGVTPHEMHGQTAGNNDILYPETSATTNSDDTSGTTNSGCGATSYFDVEQPTPVNWNQFIYWRGRADFAVAVPGGTLHDSYGGTIMIEPTAIP